MAMDLSDPKVFRQVFEEHERGVHAAAMRILGNAAQAQDVVQDVFLRVWRRPTSFDARRGELGSYLRLMARSRALDLWRE
jgi:RNA polymerase sigma-70 factor (ECF subfamily)